MSTLDVVDETFVAAPPTLVADALAGAARWRRWWPDLHLELAHDRGPAGLRWTVTGALRGTMEMWLEPVGDGTVVHHFLRAEVDGAEGRTLGALAHARRLQAKAVAFEVKATLERGRAPGEPPAHPVAGQP